MARLENNKMASEELPELLVVEEIIENNPRLDDSERLKLISIMKRETCLWSCDGKYSKEEWQEALTKLEEEFDFKYTDDAA